MPVFYTLLVKGLIEKRVSAKLASDFVEDLTSMEELNKLNIQETLLIRRERGTGRPTKRERREIDKLREDIE